MAVSVSALMIQEIKRIIKDSEITKEDDSKWPQKNKDGRQELEIRIGSEHIQFETAKIGSLVDVTDSADPEGLRVFYYLVQDLKALVFSLISLHFKVGLLSRLDDSLRVNLLTWHSTDQTNLRDNSSMHPSRGCNTFDLSPKSGDNEICDEWLVNRTQSYEHSLLPGPISKPPR
jgi:hypothetical protein